MSELGLNISLSVVVPDNWIDPNDEEQREWLKEMITKNACLFICEIGDFMDERTTVNSVAYWEE